MAEVRRSVLVLCGRLLVRPRWIDADTGRRSDVPHHYIYNRNLHNVKILSGYHVKRVIFEYVIYSLRWRAQADEAASTGIIVL